jgi:hypothetical protein
MRPVGLPFTGNEAFCGTLTASGTITVSATSASISTETTKAKPGLLARKRGGSRRLNLRHADFSGEAAGHQHWSLWTSLLNGRPRKDSDTDRSSELHQDRFLRVTLIRWSLVANHGVNPTIFFMRRGLSPYSSLDGKTPDQAYFNQSMPEGVAA